jgi:hypothetical protein
MLAVTIPASANSIIFDNTGGSFPYTQEGGSGGNSYLGNWISAVAVDTPITGLNFYDQFLQTGLAEFVIFDVTAAPTLVFESAPQAFAAESSDTWNDSDAFSFTLLEGHQYDMTLLANVDVEMPYAFHGTQTENGITGDEGNANIYNFSDPSDSGSHACCFIPMQIVDGPAPSLTPEPGTLTLFGMAMVTLARKLRRRRP